MNRSLAYSIALHALLLLPLAFPSGPGSGKGQEGREAGNGDSEGGDIVPKSAEGQPPEPISMDIALIEAPKPTVSGQPDCPSQKFYGGIGIVQSWDTGIVNEVASGYPAARAGLRPGDKIIGNPAIRGDAGTPVSIAVWRGNETLLFNIVRENICIDPKPTKELSP